MHYYLHDRYTNDRYFHNDLSLFDKRTANKIANTLNSKLGMARYVVKEDKTGSSRLPKQDAREKGYSQHAIAYNPLSHPVATFLNEPDSKIPSLAGKYNNAPAIALKYAVGKISKRKEKRSPKIPLSEKVEPADLASVFKLKAHFAKK